MNIQDKAASGPSRRKPDRSRKNLPAKRIVFLAFPGVVLLDLAGPWDVFEGANMWMMARSGHSFYDLQLVSAGDSREVGPPNGLSLFAACLASELIGDIDTLIFPGSSGMHALTPEQVQTPDVMRLLGAARRVVSVCVGAFVLAAAGWLDGRRATTHWLGFDTLAARFPEVTVDRDSIFVQDGSIYTSGGMTAGIDLALALVEEDLGREAALETARRLVIPSRRPGGQAQYGPSSVGQQTQREPLNDLLAWAKANPGADLSVSALAQKLGMSERHFSRIFRRETGKTPGEFVERLRVDSARQRLEASNESLDDIAQRCGLGSADSMRRVFLRVIKVTPGAYRSRFRAQ